MEKMVQSQRRPELSKTYSKLGDSKLGDSKLGIADINKDQHSSASSTQESIIGELKQHGGSEFDYSTTAVESSWEPRGVLQPKQKIEDSAKGEEMQRLQQLRRGRRRNK
ncbi:hypothetical protein GW17_00050790 [Ensete ventricosum]|nr:hypothetical protein GW17_00050790 [Ensete ventricosum]